MPTNAEFFRAIKVLSETNPDTWEAFVNSREMGEVIEYVDNRRFVNVYELSRDYGGPEEGGWYYDSGFPVLSIETMAEYADAIVEMLREEFPNYGNRYSVIHYSKPSDYTVYVESHPAAEWSDYSPWE